MASVAQAVPRSDLSLPDEYGLVIGGEEVTPTHRFAAVDPSTGLEWASVARASDDHVDEAVRAAAAAFRGWRRSSLAERQELLWRLGERVAEAPYWPAMLAIEN